MTPVGKTKMMEMIQRQKPLGYLRKASFIGCQGKNETRERSRLPGETTDVVETPWSWLSDEVFESFKLPMETKGDRKRDVFERPNSDMQNYGRQKSCFEWVTTADPKTGLSTVLQEDVIGNAVSRNNRIQISVQSSPEIWQKLQALIHR